MTSCIKELEMALEGKLRLKRINTASAKRIAELEGIVKRYVQHEPGCRAGDSPQYTPDGPRYYPCNCGLSAALTPKEK